MTEMLQTPGEPVSKDELSLPNAHALAAALAAEHTVYSTLIECRRNGDDEVVVLEVEVERPQLAEHDIRARERLAVVFTPNDSSIPRVLALRSDFPRVPHQNLQTREIPRDLCLYDQPYHELKTRWTPERFVERIREWLALTATGELHPADQPLEPLLLPPYDNIFLPKTILEADSGAPIPLNVTILGGDTTRPVLLAQTSVPGGRSRNPPPALASIHRCRPRTHGVVEQVPQTFADVCEIAGRAGLDLRAELAVRMRDWRDDEERRRSLLRAKIVVVLVFPHRRSENAAPEREDVWAFLLLANGATVGEHLGLWEQKNGNLCPIIGPSSEANETKVEVAVLNPSFYLTPALAATYGANERPQETKITAIGVGALGSHVVLDLVRGGFGEWTLIDEDILMPHNLARHALDGGWLGRTKATSIALFANSFFNGHKPCKAVVADVLTRGTQEPEVSAALESAEIILDMSASVSVSRSLSFSEKAKGRRISLFLSPTGRDLVVIAEGITRSPRLDELEMQYYRAIAQDERMVGHLGRDDVRRHRYGQSCRDLSARIPHELVALHGALASRAIRAIAASPEPRISVWRANEDGSVAHVAIDTAATKSASVDDWTVSISEHLLARLHEIRARKLPHETGGVLLGTFDFAHRLAYVVDTVPSPEDSIERKTSYVRGCEGLRERIETIQTATDGMLEYVGEWHSHPRGASTDRSPDDERLLHWVRDTMGVEGLPAVMLIAGDSRVALSFAPPVTSDSVFVQVDIS